MKKIFTSFILLFVAILAQAYDFKVDGLCYAILEGGYSVEVTSEFTSQADYQNNYADLQEVEIPYEVEYDGVQYTVLGVGENAFTPARNLESVEFSGIEYGRFFYIKSRAFAGCSKLKEVDFVSVNEFGNQSFADTAIEEVELNGNVKITGNPFSICDNLTKLRIFGGTGDRYDSRENCNAIIETKTNTLISGCKNSTVPSSVTAIGEQAFYACENLTLENLPTSVISIGRQAFAYCTNLAIEHLPTSVVNVGANAFDYTPLYPLDKEPEEGAHYIDHILYKYYSTDYETPRALVVKEGTLGIAEYACAGYKISSVTLPTSLKCIESGAFTRTQLSQLSLPASVEYIGDYAFSNNLLTTITIPENVKYIGEYAFAGSNLSTITIPENVKYIGKDAFASNPFTSITWNAIDCETVELSGGAIASSVFGSDASYYSLKSFTFGNKVKTIPNSLCGGVGFSVEEGIEITLPSSVEKIGHKAFAASGIKTITIPENVKSIGNAVFDFCLKLNSATWNAKNCTRISQTNEYNDEIISEVFGTTNYLEEGAQEATTLGVKSITFGSGVTNIPQSLCKYNKLITSVTLPSSVKSIENNAFAFCKNLSHVTLGGNEESIHPGAFYGTPWWDTYNENLPDGPIYLSKSLIGYKGEMPENTTINVKEGTVSITNGAFYGQENLVAVTFPESLKEIGARAFNNCSNLKEITIPKNVTNIGENAFTVDYLEKVTWNAINCESPYKEIYYGGETLVELRFIFDTEYRYDGGSSSIETFIFGNEVENIPDALCYGMKSLKDITLPNSVKKIGKSAFNGTSIAEITIPEGVEYVGGGAFSDTDLRKVVWNAIDCKVDEIRKEGDITYFASIFGDSDDLTSFTFGNKVKNIPAGLCRYLSIQSLVIPESVETIGSGALLLGICPITEINIPASVKSMGDNAINWNGLEKYIVDEDNTVYASKDGILYTKDFSKILEVPSNLKGEINIPAVTENVMEHKDWWDSPLTAINIDEAHETLSSAEGVLFNKDKTILYYYPRLKEGEKYSVPSTVATIDTMAFKNMYLKELEMSDNVTKIELAAFYMPALEKIKLSNSIKEIPHYAFMYSGELKTIIIPEGVESIGVGAFMGCENLSMAVIPSTVKKIGTEAFIMQGTNLRNIYCYATTPPALWWVEDDDWADSEEEYIFSNFNANLHVPAEALEDYKFHPQYTDFKYIMPMGEVTVPVESVVVSPNETSAQFTWPVVENAVSYTLKITFEGEVFCTLDFNAYGQLIALNFAPTKRNAVDANGFQFTVTGLEGETEYAYSLEAKDAEGKVLDTMSGEFTTTGAFTGVEETESTSIRVQGGLVICDNADLTIYNISGLDVTSLNGNLTSGVYVVSVNGETVKVMVK